MNNILLSILACLLSIFLTLQLYAQKELSIDNVKVKRCRVVFSLTNLTNDNYTFWNPSLTHSQGKYSPQYYTIEKDTLEINLSRPADLIQSSHRLTDTIIIDGERITTNITLNPNQAIHFSIPKLKGNKVSFIKLILSEKQTIYYTKSFE